MKRSLSCLVVLVLLTGYLLTAAAVHAAAPFYQGKTIEITVPSRAGGGTDTMARIISSFLPTYVPGKPSVVLRNVPGGAGVIGNNVFYVKGKPDGLHLMMNASSSVALQLRSRDIVKYDLTKYKHIGHINRGSNLLLIRKATLKRLYDPKAEPVVCGTKEGEETWLGMALWGKEVLGWNIRFIPGYAGTSDLELALRRGELDMFGTSNAFIINRLREEGLVTVITQGGIYKNKKYVRRPDFPDDPTFVEVLGKKKPDGLSWQAYMAWIGPEEVDKFLVAPRNTPKEYIAILTAAFEKITKDPKFDQLVKQMVSDFYGVGVGQETGDLLKEVLTAPLEALDYGRNLQVKYGLVATKK